MKVMTDHPTSKINDKQNASFAMQAIGEYKASEQASSLKMRDYKDATDLICKGENDMDAVVRRLTECECERLQGFPDNWTLIGEPEEVEVKDYDIKYDENGDVIEKTFVGTHMETEYFYTDEDGKRKKCSASARYKALGNSIALPYWTHLLRRISAQYERPATLGSLFSGIGGFDLCWVRCNGTGTVLWSSEIESFPIAVMKKHFGDEDAGIEGDIKNYL